MSKQYLGGIAPHTHFASAHAIGDRVRYQPQDSAEPGRYATVESVTFTESKVLYGLKIEPVRIGLADSCDVFPA
jgi:hypothetical protein